MQSTHNRTELEMSTETVPDEQRVPDQRARTIGGPDSESELGLGEANRDPTTKESELPRDRGLTVTLWVFASLIAEVEVLWWMFGRMYAHV